MKTTKAQFNTFCEYVKYWQQELGLTDWHIYTYHRPLKDSFATTQSSVDGRGVTVIFATNWDDREPNDKELKESALHEVLHIVTAPLVVEARARFADEHAMDAAEHSIVTRMTNYINRITV